MMRKWFSALIFSGLLLTGLVSDSNDQTSGRRGGFTGPEVPSLTPLLGDYVHVGVKRRRGRVESCRYALAWLYSACYVETT